MSCYPSLDDGQKTGVLQWVVPTWLSRRQKLVPSICNLERQLDRGGKYFLIHLFTYLLFSAPAFTVCAPLLFALPPAEPANFDKVGFGTVALLLPAHRALCSCSCLPWHSSCCEKLCAWGWLLRKQVCSALCSTFIPLDIYLFLLCPHCWKEGLSHLHSQPPLLFVSLTAIEARGNMYA